MSSSATNKLVGTLSRKNKSKLKVASTAFTEYVEIHAAWANFHENFVIVYSSGIYFAPSPTFFFIFPLQSVSTCNLTLYFNIFIITHLFISVVVCVNLTETSIYLFFILDDISS